MPSIKNMSYFLIKSKVLGLQIITFFFLHKNTLVDFLMLFDSEIFRVNAYC